MKSNWIYKVFSASLIVMLAIAALPVTPARAADTGLNSPTSCTSGGGEWTNPTFATVSDNQYTQANANNEDIICTFNLPAIPAGNTIVGIEVIIEGLSSGTREAAVDLSWTGGIDPPGPGDGYTTGDPSTTFGSTETTFTLGSTSNTWGRTWSNTEFTSANFRVRLTANNGSGTISLDHIQVRVTYFPPLTITASTGAGGTITPSGAVSVDNGEDQDFDIEPNSNFIVSDVLVDGVSQGRINYYEFTNVTVNHTISATFDGGWYEPSDSSDTGWGNTDDAEDSDNQYADANGAGDVAVFEDFNFSIPSSATINGIEVAIEGRSETTAEVSVDLSWNGGATYTGSDPSTNFVNGGNDATILLGGVANNWGRTWSPTEFSNANFRLRLTTTGADDIEIDQVQIKVHFTAPSHTITATDDGNGTITPSGAVVVYEGFDQEFDITPGTGFIVSNVLVDAASQGRINYYEFTNVTANHTIHAPFDGGWSQPSADVDAGWGNEDEAYVSDNNYAVANDSADIAQFFNFGLSIPGGATITGIEVAIEGHATTTRELVVDLSWNNGTTFTPTTFTTSFVNGSSDATLILGGTTETWGRTWLPAEFTNFRIRLDATGGGGDVNVDQVQVKVHYTTIVTPTLSITNSPATYNGSPQAATVTCSSGGAVSNILYNGSATAPTNVGTYAVTADCAAMPGFSALTGASAGNFVIDPATPTASITNSPVIYNGSAQTALVACSGGGTATLASGGTGTNAGSYPATVNCAASANYTAATGLAAGNFVIDPATPTASITNSPVTYNGSAQTALVACLGGGTATLASGGTGTNAGSYPATVDCAASANYSAATGLAAGNFVIDPATPTLTVTNGPVDYDGSPHSATVACLGGGTPSNILTGGSASQTNAGTYPVTADCAASTNYSASTGLTAGNSFVINQITPTASVTNSPQNYTGAPQSAIVACLGGGVASNILTGGSATQTDAGTYPVTADCAASTNYAAATGVSAGDFVINPIAPTASVTNSPQNYTGAPQSALVSCTGGGVASNILTGGSATQTNAGTYPVTADCAASTNYIAATGLSAGDFVINSIAQNITVTTNAPANAVNGSNFDVAATASSGLPVTITVSGVCTIGDVDGSTTDGDATIAMTSGTGTCSVFYDQAGNTNYNPAPQVQEDVNATDSPVFTSANNTTFDFGFTASFNITATGNPSTMTITITGEPAGITITDNGDGTATLDGDGTTPVGVYSIIFTANNGVLPNGTQTFTLTIRNGPAVSIVNSSPDTGNGSVSENENISTTLGITQFTVEFDRDVYDPSGDTDPDDVTNPANYLLVRSATGTFSTASCSGGLVAPDVQISVDSVTYSNGGGSGPFVATLSVNSGLPLNVAGFYRLFVCGTTSIVDAGNPLLVLAGNGVTPGTDFTRNFRVTAPATGGGGGGGGGTSSTTTPSLTGVLIPVTGFAPSQITDLPAQPIEKEYAVSPLTLKIPSLGVNLPIVGVDFDQNGWDVTWLGNNAGYLEGSAYPTWNGNSILTSHVTDPNGKPGPFAYVNELRDGDKVYIHNDGFIYVYEVRESSLISPRNIKTLFKSEEDAWLTLVTCENFNEKTNTFTHRRMIRAVLISVIPEK